MFLKAERWWVNLFLLISLNCTVYLVTFSSWTTCVITVQRVGAALIKRGGDDEDEDEVKIGVLE